MVFICVCQINSNVMSFTGVSENNPPGNYCMSFTSLKFVDAGGGGLTWDMDRVTCIVAGALMLVNPTPNADTFLLKFLVSNGRKRQLPTEPPCPVAPPLLLIPPQKNITGRFSSGTTKKKRKRKKKHIQREGGRIHTDS